MRSDGLPSFGVPGPGWIGWGSAPWGVSRAAQAGPLALALYSALGVGTLSLLGSMQSTSCPSGERSGVGVGDRDFWRYDDLLDIG